MKYAHVISRRGLLLSVATPPGAQPETMLLNSQRLLFICSPTLVGLRETHPLTLTPSRPCDIATGQLTDSLQNGTCDYDSGVIYQQMTLNAAIRFGGACQAADVDLPAHSLIRSRTCEHRIQSRDARALRDKTKSARAIVFACESRK